MCRKLKVGLFFLKNAPIAELHFIVIVVMDEGSPTPQVPQPMRAALAPAGFTNLIPGKLIMLYWLKISM